MDINESTAALFTGLGTLLGGLGLKFWEHRSKKEDAVMDEATQIRKELRDEAKALRDEIKRTNKELDTWRERYYLLLAEHTTLQQKYSQILLRFERLTNRMEKSEDVGEEPAH